MMLMANYTQCSQNLCKGIQTSKMVKDIQMFDSKSTLSFAKSNIAIKNYTLGSVRVTIFTQRHMIIS